MRTSQARSNLGPSSSPNPNPSPNPSPHPSPTPHLAGEVVCTWSLVQSFIAPLELSPFSPNDLCAALQRPGESVRCRSSYLVITPATAAGRVGALQLPSYRPNRSAKASR
eukprot:scaffold28902_cov45-Phaeocystis_antarctica.AAC.2